MGLDVPVPDWQDAAMYFRRWLFILLASAAAGCACAAGLWLVLPTENQSVFQNAPDRFYMYVDRLVDGKMEQALGGGFYGFTRTPLQIGGTVVYTQFHEGVDIRPLRHDARGEPLDPVTAPADGRVVHVSNVPGNSNYGRYVVVEHTLQGAPYYTLYAHLAAITVARGDAVRQGDSIGRIGYTGAGINKSRAHLHYEFCLMLNRNFGGWFKKHHPQTPDTHGIFNGMNLAGLDPVGLTRAVRADPALTVTNYIRGQTPLFRLIVNATPRFDLLRLYPWLIEGAADPRPAAWAVTFSSQFIPMRAERRADRVAAPAIEWLGPAAPALIYQSRKLISGTPGKPALTPAGQRWVNLLTFPE
ncbi:MAG: M23 family metallopeptidase [Lentisphaerae bacterium]|nr:M23 family metallopeptidase [Lentisphaerota bacterium]